MKERGGEEIEYDVEQKLIDKYQNIPRKIRGHELDEPIANLKKQAVLDPVLFNNKNYMKSLAEFKHIWAGSGPMGDKEDDPMQFHNQDLITWFRMYNQTQLENAKKYLATKGTEDEAALVLAQ